MVLEDGELVFMTKKKTSSLPAVVSYMSFLGLGIVRSLGQKGITVYAVDPSQHSVGMNSKYCKALICPDIKVNEKGYLDFMISLGKSFSKKAVFYPTGDVTVLFYTKYRQILEQYYEVVMPSKEKVESLLTKDGLTRSAEEAGIPYPKAYFPKCLSDVEKIKDAVEYPVIFKPAISSSWRTKEAEKIIGSCTKVIEINDSDALINWYKKLAAYDANLIIQQVIPGEDSLLYYTCFYCNRESQPLAFFAGRKRRIFPVHYGSASFVESIYDEELKRLTFEFLAKVKYQGLGGMEFKKDLRDGKYRLIEFNTRFGLWDILGKSCGVDIPWIAYQDTINQSPEAVLSYRPGPKWVSLARDFAAFRKYRREGTLSFYGWMRSFIFNNTQGAVFLWKDPMPFFRMTYDYWKGVMQKRLLK